MESPTENAAGSSAPPGRPPSRVMKDAAIGLAIFILVVLLWKLMTHPERFGSAGPWFKTNVFGVSGIGLAGPFGVGSGSPAGSGDPRAGGASSGTNDISNRHTPAGQALTGDGAGLPVGESNVVKSGDSAISNNLVTIIADFADESRVTNRVTGTPDSAAAAQDAAMMARRLAEAGAKGGDIQLSLFWRNRNDLDLHCFDPMGVEIFYSNKRSPLTGGELDVDQNAGGAPYNSAPVENIYWPANGAPKGIYKVFVTYYAQHDYVDPTAYTVRVLVKDKPYLFHHTIAYAGQRKTHWICTFQYDPAGANPTNRCRFLSYQ